MDDYIYDPRFGDAATAFARAEWRLLSKKEHLSEMSPSEVRKLYDALDEIYLIMIFPNYSSAHWPQDFLTVARRNLQAVLDEGVCEAVHRLAPELVIEAAVADPKRAFGQAELLASVAPEALRAAALSVPREKALSLVCSDVLLDNDWLLLDLMSAA